MGTKLLPNYLTGTAKSAYNTDIPTDLAADYEQVKKILCAALGDTVQRAADRWWTLCKQSGETLEAYCMKVCAKNKRRLSDECQYNLMIL